MNTVLALRATCTTLRRAIDAWRGFPRLLHPLLEDIVETADATLVEADLSSVSSDFEAEPHITDAQLSAFVDSVKPPRRQRQLKGADRLEQQLALLTAVLTDVWQPVPAGTRPDLGYLIALLDVRFQQYVVPVRPRGRLRGTPAPIVTVLELFDAFPASAWTLLDGPQDIRQADLLAFARRDTT